MIKISYTAPSDQEAVKKLWAEAFGDDEPYFSWYFNTVYRPERTLGLFCSGKMVSCLQYAPKLLRLHNQEIPIAYLVGVCTEPAYQGHGYASALIRRLIGDLHADYRLLMLYTDIPAFYQPLGFTHCYQLRRYIFPAAADSSILPQWRTGTLSDADIAAYNNIYQQMTANMDGYILRSTVNWREFLADFLSDGGALYLSSDAYLLWVLDQGECKIKEIGYTSPQALAKALLLARHIAAAEGYPSIIWDAPLNTPIADQQAAVIPHVMARLTDAQGTAAETARLTKNFFGDSGKLWVNEIT